ncbi:MAG: polyketide synthase dehydratase domain-containing protein [Desulfobulbaceae bacterium]|jgi:hypothetical protein|nr:polyketide synthase dehydratase domain-containing protein [Desulfobulbaceae bacterium]
MNKIITFTTELAIRPWFFEHRFAGRAVLPMVEAIDFLAALAMEKFHELDVRHISNAKFDKLLPLPDAASLPVIVEYEPLADGRVRAALMSKKTDRINRLLGHAEMVFGRGEAAPDDESDEDLNLAPEEATNSQAMRISPARIYSELVPFGPHYHSLRGEPRFDADTATAELIAPALPFACPALANPFLLDGAMHAACVHGQRFCGFVPFPVAFSTLNIGNARDLQQAGRRCRARCRLTRANTHEISYDIVISGGSGYIYLRGLLMKDVSGGAIKPPDWIVEKSR